MSNFCAAVGQIAPMASGLESAGSRIIPVPCRPKTPYLIQNWRTAVLLDVAEAALQELPAGDPQLQPDMLRELRIGCDRAARRASTYMPAEEAVTVFSPPVQRLGRLIGTEAFQAVYTAAPPPALVDRALSEGNKARWAALHTSPALHEITVEVLLGRLEWEDRFAAAGVPMREEYLSILEEQYRSQSIGLDRRPEIAPGLIDLSQRLDKVPGSY